MKLLINQFLFPALIVFLTCCAAPQDNSTSNDTTAAVLPPEPAGSYDTPSESGYHNESSDADESTTSQEPEVEQRPAIAADLTYEGQVTDEESGYSQFYTLKIRPDLSSASIGGGPYNTLQDQGGGVYMWLDGTIIGMSIMPMRDKCVIYGSEGEYFCTLYRR